MTLEQSRLVKMVKSSLHLRDDLKAIQADFAYPENILVAMLLDDLAHFPIENWILSGSNFVES